MTWSYTGNPGSSAKDAIRFLIGDTDTTDQLLSDEEIAWLNLEQTGSATSTDDLYYTAHYACHSIAAKLARLADKSIGGLSVSLSQKANAYLTQAKELFKHAQRTSAPLPYAGGITISDKEIDQENSDLYAGFFRSGQFQDTRDGGKTNTNQGVQYFGPGSDR